MMDMAKVEEAAGEAWDRRTESGVINPIVPKDAFHIGFLAGARWRDKQPIFLGVDLANGNDRMVVWPNAESDRAADDAESRPGDNGYGVITEHDLD